MIFVLFSGWTTPNQPLILTKKGIFKIKKIARKNSKTALLMH